MREKKIVLKFEDAQNRRSDGPVFRREEMREQEIIKDELYSYILQRLAFLIKVPWLLRELKLGYIKLI